MAGEQHGHGMGMAWARHTMCESTFKVQTPHYMDARGRIHDRVPATIYRRVWTLWRRQRQKRKPSLLAAKI